MKTARLVYPWASTLVGILTAAYLYAAATADMSNFYQLPAALFDPQYRFSALLLFALAVVFDSQRFHRNRRAYEQRIQHYEQQIKELLQGKNKLQHKVRKYSDHADKLKLFISDRLLEHIEYDEKFLHFRNIAAEVRHNGVICYDKVMTSLQRAAQTCDEREAEPYHDALDGMAYLWVLLDLSTTDNIAIYIANKLYEYEEQYYQQMLGGDNEPPPYSPTFSPRDAVLKAVQGFVDADTLPAPRDDETAYHYRDDRFHIELQPAGALLGDKNYLLLLVENLINNALFYSSKKRSKNRYARVAIRLYENGGRTTLSVYNKGPGIPEELRTKIFQLGFSTKRVRENNGKGLGLYFVHEIVKGYEGEIRYNNIHNHPDAYVIRIELDNGEKVTEIIDTVLNEAKAPLCQTPQQEQPVASLEYTFKCPIASIELTAQSTQKTYTIAPADGPTDIFLDPQHPDHPRWCLEIVPLKTRHKLVFRPLDVGGVRFTVAIPTAKSRLDPDYHSMADDELDDTGPLDRRFEEVNPYLS